MVRDACVKGLLHSWSRTLNGDLLNLLSRLDVESSPEVNHNTPSHPSFSSFFFSSSSSSLSCAASNSACFLIIVFLSGNFHTASHVYFNVYVLSLSLYIGCRAGVVCVAG